MSYEVHASKTFLKSLSLIPSKIQPSIIEFLYGSLASDPFRVGKPLVEPLDGIWSARRGEYRILNEVDDAAQIIRVMAVRHRRDAYWNS
jgi:mRNA-degrading endonuclease RelE of RelBE toxin-antitoxin system